MASSNVATRSDRAIGGSTVNDQNQRSKQFQAIYPNDGGLPCQAMEVNYGGTEMMCPGCGVDTKFHPLAKRRAYVCQYCGHRIYPAARTIFHKSRTNLTKWFFAMYLMTSTRHGVAAKELERQLGVTYECAWGWPMNSAS